MARRLLLVRHGPIAPHLQGRLVGATDVPLAPLATPSPGLPNLLDLAGRLERFRPQRCYCSPRLRCRQTAEALVAELREGLPICLDDDLREIDFGRWEQQTFAEIARDEPELAQRWAEFPRDFAFPGGESLAQFLERVRRATQRLLDDQGETVLVVTHGGVIRLMLCLLLELDPQQYLTFEVGYASLTVMERMADCRFQIADCRLQICKKGKEGMQIADCRLQICRQGNGKDCRFSRRVWPERQVHLQSAISNPQSAIGMPWRAAWLGSCW